MRRAWRVAIYARLSKDDEGDAESVEIQKDECAEYANTKDDWTIVGVFEDNDKSAYSGTLRPGYQELLDFIADNQVDIVLTTETSRLNRKLWNSIGLFRLAETTDLRHIATTDGGGFDLSTPQGIHNAVMAAIEAEKESIRLSERQKRRKRKQASDGKYSGGPRPFGYESNGITVRESEAEIIREAAARLLAGFSPRSIVRDLNQRGIRTTLGNRWHSLTLERVLKSKRIIGIRVHQTVRIVGGQRVEEVKEYQAQWPAILDQETWEHVQLVLSAEHRRYRHKGPKRYLLTGIAVCGRCGAPLYGGRKPDTSNDEPRPRYQCRSFDEDHYGQQGCGRISRLAEPVDLLVSEAVLYRYDSPDMARAFEQSTRPEIRALLDEYRVHKLKLDHLIADYASGLLNRHQLAQAKTIVEQALEATRAKLERIQTGRALASIPISQTVREAWEQNDDFDWRRSLISLIVEKVIIHPGYSRKHRWRGWVFDPSAVEIVWKV